MARGTDLARAIIKKKSNNNKVTSIQDPKRQVYQYTVISGDDGRKTKARGIGKHILYILHFYGI